MHHDINPALFHVILVTLLLLVQYIFFSFRAGQARGKADIKAPATTGDNHYERCNRVQLNTLEQLIVTFPAMWICALHFSATTAAIGGAAFLLGRILYSRSYLNDANRAPGMILGFLANIVMIGCGLYAVVKALI